MGSAEVHGDSTITKVEFWRRRKRLSYEALATKLGVKMQTAWRYCLAPGHKEHRRPGRGPADKLKRLTDGAVHAGNYADPIPQDEIEAVLGKAAS